MSNSPNIISRRWKTILILSGFLMLLYIVLGWGPENYLWGINHLYFHTVAARIIFSLAAILLLILPLGDWFRRLNDKISGSNGWIIGIAGAVIGIVLFSLLKVSVHSLGDGYQRAYEITRGQWYQPTQFLDFLMHVGAYRLLHQWFGTSAESAMAITSIVAGLIFILVLWKHQLFSREKKLFFALAVMSLGCSQLFFGYAESYTLLYLFGAWYLILIFGDIERPPSYWLISIIFLLAAFSHQIGLILLLPSFWYMTINRYRHSRQRLIIVPVALIIGVLPYAAIKIINRLMGYKEFREIGGYFLPFFGADYGIFHPNHLLDILNLLLLVAPILIILIPVLPQAVKFAKQKLLMLSVVAPSLLFVLLFNPELTLARDWDAFSVPMAMIAISFLIMFFRIISNERNQNIFTLSRPIMAMTVVLFSWVLLNNSTQANLQRAEYLLDHGIGDQHYGYELLAHYYHSQEDYAIELATLEKIEKDERNARIYGKLAQAAWLLGFGEQAYQYAREGVNLPNPSRLTILIAGITAYDMGRFNDAIYYLRTTARLAPQDQGGLCKLGDALLMADSLDAALEVFRGAINIDPNQARPFVGIAYVYYKMGNIQQAQVFCQEGLHRNSNYPGAQELWDLLQSPAGEKNN